MYCVNTVEEIILTIRTSVQLKIDTGAQANVMSKSILSKLDITCKLVPSDIRLNAYGGTNIG